VHDSGSGDGNHSLSRVFTIWSGENIVFLSLHARWAIWLLDNIVYAGHVEIEFLFFESSSRRGDELCSQDVPAGGSDLGCATCGQQSKTKQ